MQRLGRHTAAVAYDRAGLGLSDPSASPRTVCNLTEELHAMLCKLGLTVSTQPVVMVGTQAGCAITLLMALLHPVAGVVLVDPPPGLLAAVSAAVTKHRKPGAAPSASASASTPVASASASASGAGAGAAASSCAFGGLRERAGAAADGVGDHGCQPLPLTLRLRLQALVTVIVSAVVEVAAYLSVRPLLQGLCMLLGCPSARLPTGLPLGAMRRRGRKANRRGSFQSRAALRGAPAMADPTTHWSHLKTAGLERAAQAFNVNIVAAVARRAAEASRGPLLSNTPVVVVSAPQSARPTSRLHRALHAVAAAVGWTTCSHAYGPAAATPRRHQSSPRTAAKLASALSTNGRCIALDDVGVAAGQGGVGVERGVCGTGSAVSFGTGGGADAAAEGLGLLASHPDDVCDAIRSVLAGCA